MLHRHIAGREGREGGREGREVYIQKKAANATDRAVGVVYFLLEGVGIGLAAESRFLLVCTMRCVYVTGQTHICSEQAALLGISRRCPCWSRSGRTWASTPGYGFLPPLNTSHIVTPNDHC